jgi:pimeloyl-ACP methyl ester carboxylesterase
MAPAAVLFDASSFENVHVPVRLYRAERDQRLTYPFHAERVRKALPQEPEYIVLEGASHDAFLAADAHLGGREPSARSCESRCLDLTEFHGRLNSEIIDFFDRSLKNTSSSERVEIGDISGNDVRNGE